MTNKDISPARLEAYSDGVIAVAVTILVLELKVPHTDSMAALLDQWPVFVSYILSFIFVSEYWVNHHMLLHLLKRVDTRILWSNILLLFTISMIPFFTAFMGENHISPFTVACYSAWSLFGAFAYVILLFAVFRHVEMKEADKRCLKHASIIKCCVAQILYLTAVVTAYYNTAVALALNFVVAVMYVLPNAWLEPKKGKYPAIHRHRPRPSRRAAAPPGSAPEAHRPLQRHESERHDALWCRAY
jgi:uncharacterized membrane protein